MKYEIYFVRVNAENCIGTDMGSKMYPTMSLRKIRKELKEVKSNRWLLGLDVISCSTGAVLFNYSKQKQIYVDRDFEKQASKLLR